MKKLLTLRWLLLCVGATLALIAFFVALGGTMEGTANLYGLVSFPVSYSGALFGITYTANFYGMTYTAKLGISVFPFLGWLLLLFGLVGVVVCAFVIKDEKLRKILIICGSAAVVVGAICLFFIKPSVENAALSAFKKAAGEYEAYVTKDLIKDEMNRINARFPGIITAGVFGLLGGLAMCATQFIPEVKFVKEK